MNTLISVLPDDLVATARCFASNGCTYVGRVPLCCCCICLLQLTADSASQRDQSFLLLATVTQLHISGLLERMELLEGFSVYLNSNRAIRPTEQNTTAFDVHVKNP
jgi:hypothetical protein